MKEINVSGKKRGDLGKKASEQLRREDYVPCSIYGATQADGKSEVLAFVAPISESHKAVYASRIHVINLNIDDENHTTILKELQFHPVADALLHVDLYAVNSQKPVTIGIPVKLTGLVQGVHDGERMNLSIRKVSVTVPYRRTPEYLDISAINLKTDKDIKVGQLNFEGLEMATLKDVVACSIKMTHAVNLPTGEGTEEEDEAAAEGEDEDEAAPAET